MMMMIMIMMMLFPIRMVILEELKVTGMAPADKN